MGEGIYFVLWKDFCVRWVPFPGEGEGLFDNRFGVK